MSTPRNHHFVSQVHIKNFFNSVEKKIFVYDKTLDNHYFKKTSKSLFSEKDLNTKSFCGKNDFESLENDLNNHFEKDFSKNYTIIENFITDFKYSKEVNNALYYFVKYGVISEIRNPKYKQSTELFLENTFKELFNNSIPEFKKNLNDAFLYRKESKYINSIKYSEFADNILDKMGDLIVRIEIPMDKNDYFILPDFCAANVRYKINEYYNSDIEEIAYIGLPLSSKIYIHFYSSKIKHLTIKSDILEINNIEVFKINKTNLEFCESKVACENQNYLMEFINKVKKTE